MPWQEIEIRQKQTSQAVKSHPFSNISQDRKHRWSSPFLSKYSGSLIYKNDQGCFHVVVSAGTICKCSIKLCLIKVSKKLC